MCNDYTSISNNFFLSRNDNGFYMHNKLKGNVESTSNSFQSISDGMSLINRNSFSNNELFAATYLEKNGNN